MNQASSGLPKNMLALLAGGQEALDEMARVVKSGKGRMPFDRSRLAVPISRPSKLFAVGLNYADHVAESNQETPKYPTIFSKMPSLVDGPYDDVVRLLASEQLDYEGELAFVIGQRCRYVTRDQAPNTASPKGRLFFGFPDQDESDSSIGE